MGVYSPDMPATGMLHKYNYCNMGASGLPDTYVILARPLVLMLFVMLLIHISLMILPVQLYYIAC